jgi:hypothetical protein
LDQEIKSMKTFLAQNQFMSSDANVPVALESAAATPCPQPPAAAVPNSAEALPSSQTAGSAVALKAACPGATAVPIPVSDGVLVKSLSSVEMEPSVTEAYAPSEAAIDSCQEPVAADCTGENCENLKFVYECTDGTVFHRCAVCDRKAYRSATDCIPEIFHWVRKLLKDDRKFHLDEAAFMAAIDEEPLFLRNTA